MKKRTKTRRRVLIAAAVLGGLLVLLGASAAIASALGVDLTKRQVPEVRRALQAYEDEDYAQASDLLEKGTTDLDDERGKLWLDRGLALAKLEKSPDAQVALRKAAGDAKASREVRSQAYYSLGNLALDEHRDLEAVEEFRQALRIWPENRDAAWNLSIAKRRLYIDACRIGEPAQVKVVTGEESEEIKGLVFEPHRTDQPGQLEGLKAQFGIGPDGIEPTEENWAWLNAEYAGETEQGGGEAYVATFKAGPPGRYDYAFRFRQPGGPWQVCDLDGSEVNGFTPDQAGDAVVLPPGQGCAMIEPSWLIVAPGDTSGPAKVAVGVGEGADPTNFGTVEIGFGPNDSDPSAANDAEGWTWTETAQDGFSEEEIGSIPIGSPVYVGQVQPEEAGRYDYAFRFLPAGQEDWLYCDFNGSADGYQPQVAGDLVARDLPDAGCLLYEPPRTQGAPGAPTEPIFGIVHQEGEPITPLRVEIGYGADGSNPEQEGWTWTEAGSSEDAPRGWAGYSASLTAPEEQGAYDFAVRFRRGGEGAPWTVCDLDGSEVDGYDPVMAGELLVQDQQNQDQQDQQDEEEQEQEDQQDEQENQDQQDEEQQDEEQQDPQEQDMEEEQEQQLPEDMESALDALQQDEQTFLPPSQPRQVTRDW